MKNAFNRLEHIARRPMAEVRLQQLLVQREARRDQEERLTTAEHLEFGLAGFDAGRIPEEAGLFWVFRVLVDWGPGEEQIQEVYSARFHDRFAAIRRAHGLAEDEGWPPGEGASEHESLNAEFEAARECIEADVLREWAHRLGHPLLRRAADLIQSDRLAFEQQVEKGRQWFFDSARPQDGSEGDDVRGTQPGEDRDAS
ncbi:MAG TPA: hypothetical protein VM431_12760 [Phycisphaerae bacterium]|nr:hypothetical protein [Phycisphaerae bacterium]HUU85651.1 hypothetical protein [Phycisphaerae bacterium]